MPPRKGEVLSQTSVPELFSAFAVSWAQESLLVNPKETEMRLLTLAALLIAAMTLPVQATTQPVKGAVHGTATAATGVAKGAGQAGVGVAKGTVTVARSTGRGVLCIVTLGNRC
jgi:hypothetical protein